MQNYSFKLRNVKFCKVYIFVFAFACKAKSFAITILVVFACNAKSFATVFLFFSFFSPTVFLKGLPKVFCLCSIVCCCRPVWSVSDVLLRHTGKYFKLRNFRGEKLWRFWRILDIFGKVWPPKNIFFKKSRMFIRNELQMPTRWKLKQLTVAWICLKIIKFYQLIIRKSYIFTKSIVTNHSREFILEILRISSLVKLSPRESFFP